MIHLMLPLFVIGLAAGAAAEPVPLGAAKHLFLDDHLVASMENVTRTIHPAVKYEGNPVLWPEAPWEGAVALVYGSVLRDGDAFKMWYHNGQGVGYAESDDGLAWRRPELGLIPVEGHDTNTVILRNAEEGSANALPYFYEMFGVHRNRDETRPDERYVMGYLSIDRKYQGPRQDPFHGGQRRGLGVAVSADGIHWKLADSWATEAICDGGTHWMFDPSTERYVLYGRTKHIAPGLKEAWGADPWVDRYFWGRSVARVESPDFRHWDYVDPATAPVVMTADVQDTPGNEIYSMQVFPYGALYIGLVQVFHNQEDACHLDVQLALSHDSVHFTRVGDRRPFIPCGGIGCWDRFNTSVANNPPIEVGDDLRFYYSGRTYRHGPYAGPDKGESGGGIGFAAIQRDRFVSLDASFDGGVVETVPVRLEGSTLHLNAACAFGEILVEVLEPETRALVAKSKPLRGDGLDLPVEWEEGDLGEAKAASVLRLTLRNARLYALWCTDGPQS